MNDSGGVNSDATKAGDSALPIIFYDGECGLCHGFVKYVLTRDVKGIFSFSALQGEAIRGLVDEQNRAELPDTVVVLTDTRELLTRSEAVRYVLRQLPGGSRILARCLGLFPLFLRNFGYVLIARVRGYIFARPEGVCPVIPPELARRFLA